MNTLNLHWTVCGISELKNIVKSDLEEVFIQLARKEHEQESGNASSNSEEVVNMQIVDEACPAINCPAPEGDKRRLNIESSEGDNKQVWKKYF